MNDVHVWYRSVVSLACEEAAGQIRVWYGHYVWWYLEKLLIIDVSIYVMITHKFYKTEKW